MGLTKNGKPLTYKGTAFHRIIPDLMAQGGDITQGTGKGGESIYGKYFDEEYLDMPLTHNKRGIISAPNDGKVWGPDLVTSDDRDKINSQFFITLSKKKEGQPWLDGNHVVFGEILEGHDVLDKLENIGTATKLPEVISQAK